MGANFRRVLGLFVSYNSFESEQDLAGSLFIIVMQKTLRILLGVVSQEDRLKVQNALESADVRTEQVVVSDFTAVLESLRRDAYDCAVLDDHLMDGDGVALVQILRSVEVNVALLVLTDRADEQAAIELIQVGAATSLTKQDVSTDRLEERLQTSMRLNAAVVQTAVANQRLRESEERYRLILEGLNDGIWDWDFCDNRIYCNDRLYEMVGFTRDELAPTYETFAQFYHPDDRDKVNRVLTFHLEQGIPYEVELRLRHRSGGYINCLVRGKSQHNSEGLPVRMTGTVRDVTKNRQLAEALRVSESQFRQLTDSNLIGVSFTDLAGVVTEANDGFLQIVGYTREDLRLGRINCREITSPDYQVLDEQKAQELRISRVCKPFEKEYVRKDGSRVAVMVGAAMLEGSDHYAIAFVLDISESKARLRERQDADAKITTLNQSLTLRVNELQTLLGVIPIGVGIADDPECKHIRANLQLVKLLGLPSDRATALTPLDPIQNSHFKVFQRGQAPPEVELPMQHAVANGIEVWDQEIDVIRDDGTIVNLVESAVPLFDASNQVRGCLSTFVDITERKQTEERLRQAVLSLGEQQQQLRTLHLLNNLLNQRLAYLPDLLHVMVQSICEAIPAAQFGFIALYNSEMDLLEWTAKAGEGVEKLEQAGSIQARLLSEVFLTGKPLLMQEELEDSSTVGAVPASMYGVAIESAQAGRLGVLVVGNWQERDVFTAEIRYLLWAFREQAAIAINNGRLIKALEEREERLAVQNNILSRQNVELERQRQQIQAQNLKLVEASQVKSQFLGTISHELRTPMNAILGFSRLLLRQTQGVLPPKQANMVERILNNGIHLLNLINDVLDFSRLEAERLELKLEPLDLVQLTTVIVAELRLLAHKKQLTIHLVSDLTQPHITNDRLRLRQILVNLLSNAIKFTDAGSVQVRLHELNPDRVEITVTDTGIGIAEANLPHIFEAFRQVNQTITRKHGGTGLGLAITEWLVKLMQGEITVESRLGVGSVFRVELPRQIQS